LSIVICAHNDLDGRCAAAVAYRELKNRYDEIICIETDYNLKQPTFTKDMDKVYILDYSLKRDKFNELIDIVGRENVVHIDHHKSVIEGLTEFSDLKGMRSIDYSGAMLTWLYFHPDAYNVIKPKKSIPCVVALVDDYDRWVMRYGDNTLHFYEYTQSIDLSDIKGNIWDYLLSLPDDEFKPLFKLGKDAKDIKYRELNQMIDEIGFPLPIMWEDKMYSCLMINSTHLRSASQLGHIIYKERNYDLAWIFYHKLDEVTGGILKINQLRSVKIDVSRIAVKYGGGGHKNAAGFTERKTFTDFITCGNV